MIYIKLILRNGVGKEIGLLNTQLRSIKVLMIGMMFNITHNGLQLTEVAACKGF